MADDLLGLGKAADALSKPLQDFLTKLLGPAASEAGELIADRVRYLRWKNTLHILQQSKQELDKRKLTVQNIPLKTLLPILEGASLESDDENLKTKWSNLLVSAASGNSTHPSYAKILSEITASEAKLLDYLYVLELELKTQRDKRKLKQELTNPKDRQEKLDFHKEIEEMNKTILEIHRNFYKKNLKKVFPFSQEELLICIDNLLRLKLCEHPQDEVETEVITSASLEGSLEEDYSLDFNTESVTSYFANTTLVHLTVLGNTFMKACTSESNKSTSTI
jgi:hypothetical protein